MTVKVKLLELEAARRWNENGQPVDKLAMIGAIEMGAGLSYALQGRIDKVREELQRFDTAKNELIRKYGEEKEGVVTVKNENMGTYFRDINDLLLEEVELPFKPIRIARLDLEEVKISANDLRAVRFLFEGSDEDG